MQSFGFWPCARIIVGITLAGALAGCGSSPPVRVGMATTGAVTEYGQADYSATEPALYVLRPADIISVNVFREPELSIQNVPVGADGILSLPVVGALKVEGMTTREVEQYVMQKLGAGILVNPKVSINVMQFASHVVTVEGSVEKPGMYSFKPGTRLSGAISLAAGPSRVAKLNEVAVFRQRADGIAVAKFDYAQVRLGTMMDPVLQPNDRIIVGTSGLSQFWQDFLKTVPALAIFTRL
ncbi:sugar transporter [Novosphingobium sp. AAP83]|nr:sugar transporter [Novosphingobium sp. AAP83]